MLSKNQIKLISSLHQKKYRKEEQLFFVEGKKGVEELIASSFELTQIYTTQDNDFSHLKDLRTIVSASEMKKISALATASTCLAVFKIPQKTAFATDGLLLALDDVRDPGNLGTIIRLCDWFGIKTLLCSKDTVDVYNPKVVMSTMGSLARVQVVYLDLAEFISEYKKPIYGTFMDGENIYSSVLPSEGLIIMGNEANGISKNTEEKVSHKIAIPQFGEGKKTESLNVATAAAIVLNEFKRSETF